ncbi:MAG: exopolysaccharide biosynthesis protein [Stutzerimonas stutzeri]|uniref:O-antigen ligase family protein n=1 Tax=Bosea eneae TaxID=151454 RepID=A0ABW0IT59_9HYPH|nr:MAG: exopolysaccharide biosynthesis protein [Stutzerimonas stutzeri]
MEDAIDRGGGGPEAFRARVGTFLFLVVFLFSWITLSPFVDLSGAAVLVQSSRASSALNQLLSLGLFACMLGFGLLHPMRRIILQPRVLLSLIFAWLGFVSIILSAYPFQGIKGMVLAVISVVNASVFLLLPRCEKHFARLLGIGCLIVLSVAYYGILFKPSLSIHQASEALEQINAGLWRGHFRHKNEAAVAMVVMALFGLFVMNVWSRLAGIVIVCLAFVFLVNTGGKTSTAMLPAVLVVAWVFEKVRVLRVPIAIGGVALFNLFAIGSAVIRPLGDFVSDLGIDATFTNRADVWRLAFSAIAENPLVGYGMKGFWQTSQLVNGGGSVETWAVAAAHAHNSYLEVILMMGVPGLVLALAWLIALPLYHISRIDPENEHSHLTRLFIRIWLYVIFHACLESLFFEGANPLWFTFLIVIYGLFLQTSAALTPATEPKPQGIVAHA